MRGQWDTPFKQIQRTFANSKEHFAWSMRNKHLTQLRLAHSHNLQIGKTSSHALRHLDNDPIQLLPCPKYVLHGNSD